MNACIRLLWAVALALLPVGVSGQDDGPLTLDRLYSLPRIIGTSPSGVAWSADSTRMAFLWNDRGLEFRDVWIAAVDDPRPVRVTTFPAPEPVAAGTDIEAIRRVQRAEQAPGAVDVAWFPDDRRLLVTFDGWFYRVVPGEDPVRLQRAGRQARFAPDGSALAYLREGEVWVAPLTPEGLGEARAITALAGDGVGVARYLWSPDARRLAVVVRDASGVPERVIPDYLGPDELGQETTVERVRRAFPGEEPGRTRLLVVDLQAGRDAAPGADAPRPMRLGDDDRDLLFSLDWSPDGRRLLVDTSDLYVKDRRLLSVDAETGEASLLVREREPENVMAFWSAAWAPDGRGALFVSDRDDFYHLYRVDGPGAEPRALTGGEWAVESFHIAGDAVFVVANREHPAERHVYRLPPDGGQPVRVSERPGTHEPVYAPDGRWAAVHFSSDRVPPDLFLNRLDRIGETRVTRSPLAQFADHEWVTPEYVTFPSHVDGVTIHGRLMLPPDFEPSRQYPAIIGSIYSNSLRNQWGGRTAHPLWGLDQVLVRRGYVLLNVNIRGSWGLGRQFRRRMQHDYGGIDVEDVYSGVLYLESLGSVDMARVGIWGSSYGGLMTAMSLFKRPGVFGAGVAGAPATNVRHAMTGEMRVMGSPEAQPEAYDRSSALHWAAGLEDPLMIIHGMRDRIVLFQDSLVLLEHLMLLGKGHLVELVPLPAAPHGWDTGQLYQTRYAFQKLVGFFDRHLQPPATGDGAQ